jgi:hypothetical protein
MAKEGKTRGAKRSSEASHTGAGRRGLQGSTPPRSKHKKAGRTATGSASTERDHGRSKAEREGRVHRQGTG